MLHRRNIRPFKIGDTRVGMNKSGKVTKLIVLAEGAGTPLGIHVEKASPSAVMLTEATLDNVSVKIGKHKQGKSKRLVADRAYDCNKHRASECVNRFETLLRKI